jgi:tubulin-specific chaperone A
MYSIDIFLQNMDPRLKKLRISTGVVKRCGKEKLSYRKEADMQRGKIEKMKTEGKDDADIKKMNEVIQKMKEVIHPHCKTVEALTS